MRLKSLSFRFFYGNKAARLLCLFLIALVDSCSYAADSPLIYHDKNGYLTITVPAGWKVEEYSTSERSKVQFRSPDGKASVGIIAVLDSDNVANLFLLKKEFVADHRVRFPEGRFNLLRDSICDFDVALVEYEIPTVVKEEFYYFFADGVRYDFVYGAGSAADFERYRQIALEAFCSLKLERRHQEIP